jgi:uncharacterized protein involved in exopolysaccharide biosynthesis
MERTYTFEDLKAVLRRRRWLALAVFAVVLAGGLAAALLLPAEYTASSTVQMEPRRLAADFFPAQGVVPLEDRMRTLKHGILARPVLERVVRETDFFPDLKDDMDRAVEQLRKQVEVRLEGEVPGGPPALLFVVSVRGRDPAKVKAAAELLPRYYESMTRQVLAGQARVLRQTLDAEADRMSRQLADGERKILAFKQAHLDELPESSETNARGSGRAQAMLEMEQGALLDALRRRGALLQAIPEGVTQAGLAEGAVDVAERKLQSAQAAYGADTPDVHRAQRELDEARARRDQEVDRFQKLRVDEGVARIDGEIKDHRIRLAELRKEIDQYARRSEAAPDVGQQLAALTRDYDALRAKYVSTVSRQADAASAEELMSADGAALFRVVEPAVVPQSPSAPDRHRLSLLAVLAAVAAALGAAALSEWTDGSLRGPEDAAGHGVPVLAAIPRIGRR